MNFQELRERLVERLRERVRSGELTERGLARLTGVSQPHVHNVLKGKRALSFEMCDEILHHLQMNVTDLIRPEDLTVKLYSGKGTGGRRGPDESGG